MDNCAVWSDGAGSGRCAEGDRAARCAASSSYGKVCVTKIFVGKGVKDNCLGGFGCGGVMGRVGRAPSLRAIAAALDAGVTHFDVARSYGYGEAEALVGEALRGKRDKIVIASKFGLNPPRSAGALRALKPIAQQLAATIPGARGVLRSFVGGASASALAGDSHGVSTICVP